MCTINNRNDGVDLTDGRAQDAGDTLLAGVLRGGGGGARAPLRAEGVARHGVLEGVGYRRRGGAVAERGERLCGRGKRAVRREDERSEDEERGQHGRAESERVGRRALGCGFHAGKVWRTGLAREGTGTM